MLADTVILAQRTGQDNPKQSLHPKQFLLPKQLLRATNCLRDVCYERKVSWGMRFSNQKMICEIYACGEPGKSRKQRAGKRMAGAFYPCGHKIDAHRVEYGFRAAQRNRCD